MSTVEGSKSRSIAASLQGRQPKEAAVDVQSTRQQEQPGTKVSGKPNKPKAKSKVCSVQKRLSFK